MFVKLAIFAFSLAFVSSAYNGPLAGGHPAALFPAGVDPKACPNFPICSNPAVAVNQVPETTHVAPQYQPEQYQAQPQYQAQAQYQPQAQYTAPVHQYNPAPRHYAPAASSQYSSEIQSALNRGEYIGDGDYHGEGLAEALAPGYEGQRQAYDAAPAYNHATQYNPAPAAHYNPSPAAHYNPAPAAQYNPAPVAHYNHAPVAQYSAGAVNYHGINPLPAGVDASQCPNYPFCN